MTYDHQCPEADKHPLKSVTRNEAGSWQVLGIRSGAFSGITSVVEQDLPHGRCPWCGGQLPESGPEQTDLAQIQRIGAEFLAELGSDRLSIDLMDLVARKWGRESAKLMLGSAIADLNRIAELALSLKARLQEVQTPEN